MNYNDYCSDSADEDDELSVNGAKIDAASLESTKNLHQPLAGVYQDKKSELSPIAGSSKQYTCHSRTKLVYPTCEQYLFKALVIIANISTQYMRLSN